MLTILFVGVACLLLAMLLFRVARRILVPRQQGSKSPHADISDLSIGLVDAARERNARSVVAQLTDVETDGAYSATFQLRLVDRAPDAAVAEDLVGELAKWFDLRGVDANSAVVEALCAEAARDELQDLWTTDVLVAPRVLKLVSVGCDLRLEFVRELKPLHSAT